MTTLRPYQIKGEQDVFNSFKQKIQFVMLQIPTGGGKTVTFVSIIRKFIAARKRVLLLAHREELIKQAWDHLYKHEIYSGIIKGDVKTNYALPCQVGSIQTVARRTNLPPADLIIIDEAHHALEDNSYGNVLATHFPNAWVIGVTATPYRLGGRGFAGLFQRLILGPSFKSLVSMGYLVPVRYFVASRPDLSDVKMSKGDYEAQAAFDAMKMAPIVESYFEHCKGLTGAVFAVNVEHSHKIVEQYNNAGVPAAHLDADTPKEQRRKILEAFKRKEIKIVSNVGILTEGFDFPDLEFVQLARPTKSLSLYLQMVGRITRPLFSAIKDCNTDEERRHAIAMSSKPYGYVLDNADLWEEHGLPDQEFNWQRYFDGIPKRKKKEIEEEIEMIEFVAEDEDGNVVRTKKPTEVVGLKLIEVTHSVKEKIVNLVSLKEFDRGLEMFKRMPKTGNKAGFVAFNEYVNYCRKNSLLMSDEVWMYMRHRLVDEPNTQIEEIESDRDTRIEAIKSYYKDNDIIREEQLKMIHERASKALAPWYKIKVPSSFLEKERRAYIAKQSITLPA
jgi:superfamily II DNA or RNA helicase